MFRLVQLCLPGIARPDSRTPWYDNENANEQYPKGRLWQVTGPGVPAYGAVYEYQTNSNLVRQISFKSGESATLGTITRTFEEHRDVVTDVENNWGTTPTLVSKYHYGDADVLGRHTSVVNTGSAFSPSRFTLWTYNARNELLTSQRYNGTDIGNKSSPVTTQQFVFDYDPTLDHAAHRQGQVGNRLSYEGDALEGALRYFTNEVNQYSSTSQPAEDFEYDLDGNLLEDGKQTYTYDGENRLIAVVPKPPPPMQAWRQKVTFAYDDMGRRVRKQAFMHVGQGWSTTPSVDRRFVYDGLPLTTPTGVVKGWNLLLELDGLSSNVVLYKYTWGLDLSGSRQGAGGIGGLLGMYDTKGTTTTTDDRQLAYSYNGNGDVGQLVDSTLTTASIQAKYEYYPFGGILAQSGAYANTNPFKFSTKYRDNESSLYCYPYRYHNPRLGRWLSRDPIEERGGLNLFAAMGNDPVDQIDPDGRFGCNPERKLVLPPPDTSCTGVANSYVGSKTEQEVIAFAEANKCNLKPPIVVCGPCEGNKGKPEGQGTTCGEYNPITNVVTLCSDGNPIYCNYKIALIHELKHWMQQCAIDAANGHGGAGDPNVLPPPGWQPGLDRCTGAAIREADAYMTINFPAPAMDPYGLELRSRCDMALTLCKGSSKAACGDNEARAEAACKAALSYHGCVFN